MYSRGEQTVLYVGERLDAARRRANALESTADSIETRVVDSAAAAGELLGGGADDSGDGDTGVDVDCVVSEHTERLDCLSVLEQVRDERPAMPFVVFAAEGSESLAVTTFRAGTTDYVTHTDGESAAIEELATRLDHVLARGGRENVASATHAALSALLANLPVGVLVEDASRTMLAANQALIDVLGMDADPVDLVGRDCAAAAAAVADYFEKPEAFQAEIRRTLDVREPVTGTTLALTDGRTLERDYVPYETPDGEANLWVYRDVTDRVEWERTLAGMHERLEALMHTATVAETAAEAVDTADALLDLPMSGIHLLDDEDALAPVAVTDAVRETFGTPPTYRRGAGGVDEVVWEVFESGSPRVVTDTTEQDQLANETVAGSGFIQPLGDHGVFISSATATDAVDDRSRHLMDILATLTTAALDRAEREGLLREREDALERENERLDAFARTLSHDVRTPLAVATGRLELAREEHDDDSDHLAAVADALDRLDELIEDVLTLAREGARVETTAGVSVLDCARDAWDHVQTGDATLELGAEWTTDADPTRLGRLFENLFHNAVEHGGSGVHVRVGALSGAEGFYLEDDGAGIPPAERRRVFEEGYSTTAEGTGFGLAIVQRIAWMHGWRVLATESADGGARFEFRADGDGDGESDR